MLNATYFINYITINIKYTTLFSKGFNSEVLMYMNRCFCVGDNGESSMVLGSRVQAVMPSEN